MRKLVFFALFFLAACNSSTETSDGTTGSVIGITDGDTIEVFYDGVGHKVRLAEVDCPEKSQPFGKRAKEFTSDLCFGKQVKVVATGTDQYNRIIATVYIGELNLNKELVRAGMAWQYKEYSKDEEYTRLEQTARENKVGLWADEHPIEPSKFRRTEKERRQKKAKKSKQGYLPLHQRLLKNVIG